MSFMFQSPKCAVVGVDDEDSTRFEIESRVGEVDTRGIVPVLAVYGDDGAEHPYDVPMFQVECFVDVTGVHRAPFQDAGVSI